MLRPALTLLFVCSYVLTDGLPTARGGSLRPWDAKTASFRTHLWSMEYRLDEETEARGGKSGTPEMLTSTSAVTENDRAGASTEPHMSAQPSQVRTQAERFAGELSPPQLRQSATPAGWQLEAAADRDPQEFKTEPTAWELSRIKAFRRAQTTRTAGGPSVITFAVAIASGIVFTGALVSGRE